MDSNDIAIILACIASISSLIVASVTAYYNRQTAQRLEDLKSKYQVKHTKFAAYHARQVDVLSHIYSLLAQVNRQFEFFKQEWVIAQYFPFADEKLKKINPGRLERNELIANTHSYFEEIHNLYKKLKAYYEDNAIYLESDLYRNIDKPIKSVHHYLMGYDLYNQESPSIGGNDFASMMHFFVSGEQNVQEGLKYINEKFKELIKE